MKKIISFLFICFCLCLPFSVSALENDKITLYFFHGDGCPHCAAEEKYLETLEDKYPDIKIVSYEVWHNEENDNLLSQVKTALKIDKTGVPVTIIGKTYMMGYGDSTGGKIERAIEYYQKNEYVDVVYEVKKGTFDGDIDVSLESTIFASLGVLAELPTSV